MDMHMVLIGVLVGLAIAVWLLLFAVWR